MFWQQVRHHLLIQYNLDSDNYQMANYPADKLYLAELWIRCVTFFKKRQTFKVDVGIIPHIIIWSVKMT